MVPVYYSPAYVCSGYAFDTTRKARWIAESQGFSWDAGLWPMALASNGGAGYSTFNGLAIAAREALRAGAKSVLILDLDAHCGGGTASLIGDEFRVSQLDVSLSDFDSYPNSDRARLDIVDASSDYLPTIQRRLADLDRQGLRFDLCLYNAGMDPCEDCSTGGKPGVDRPTA